MLVVLALSRSNFVKEKKGETAFEPWNLAYKLSGDLIKKQDPYFPFETAVLRYAESFANLGIGYEGATLNLDLLDREKKYSNGFCHWPQPAWLASGGEKWIPSSDLLLLQFFCTSSSILLVTSRVSLVCCLTVD